MRGRIVLAVLLLAVAAAWFLTLQGFDLFPGGIATWWPLILVAVGALGILGSPRDWQGGALLVVAGGALLAWRLGYLPDTWWPYLAPIGLVLLALVLLLPPWRGGDWRERARSDWRRGHEGDLAVFSEVRHDAKGGEIRNEELTAVFGNLHADLRGATLPPQGGRLKATGVFGGVDVRVPPEWRIELHGAPVFGAVRNDAVSPPGGPVLRIEAVSVFGNVEVSN